MFVCFVFLVGGGRFSQSAPAGVNSMHISLSNMKGKVQFGLDSPFLSRCKLIGDLTLGDRQQLGSASDLLAQAAQCDATAATSATQLTALRAKVAAEVAVREALTKAVTGASEAHATSPWVPRAL